MNTLFIRNLLFSGAHGAQRHEKSQKQNFGIDVTLAVDTRPAFLSDNLKDAVDYAPIRELIRDIIENSSFNLIETIVHTIADRILLDSRISTVTITLTKLDIWGNGTPGISITQINGNTVSHQPTKHSKDYRRH